MLLEIYQTDFIQFCVKLNFYILVFVYPILLLCIPKMERLKVILSSWAILVILMIFSIQLESRIPSYDSAGSGLGFAIFVMYVFAFIALIPVRFFIHNLISSLYDKYYSENKS